MQTNYFEWHELRRLLYYINSRYAQFGFEHKKENSNCPPDEEVPFLFLESEGKRMLRISITVEEYKAPNEDQTSDLNHEKTFICLEVNGQMSFSFISQLNCYAIDKDTVSELETNSQKNIILWRIKT